MSGKGSIFILLIASSLLMASCQRYDIQEVLFSHEEASLTWKGDVHREKNEVVATGNCQEADLWSALLRVSPLCHGRAGQRQLG